MSPFFLVKFTPLNVMMEIKGWVNSWVGSQLNQLIVISNSGSRARILLRVYIYIYMYTRRAGIGVS